MLIKSNQELTDLLNDPNYNKSIDLVETKRRKFFLNLKDTKLKEFKDYAKKNDLDHEYKFAKRTIAEDHYKKESSNYTRENQNFLQKRFCNSKSKNIHNYAKIMKFMIRRITKYESF